MEDTTLETPLQQPPYVPGMAVLPTCAPERMDHHDRSRIRAAAFKATRVYPGPVGQLINAELLAYDEFGFRLGSHARVTALMLHIEHCHEAVTQPAA